MRRFAISAVLTLAGTLAFAQAPAPGKPMPKVKNKEEGQAMVAFQAAQQSGDPDSIIKAAEDLVTKFADTDFKAYAFSVEATAYEQKGDHEKAIVFAERAIETDAATYDSMILLANIYANTTRENDLDKEDKLKKAEKYATDGMAAVIAAAKPNAQVTDAQWTSAKNAEQAQALQALGSIAMVRKKYDIAMDNYQKAIALDPDPIIMLRAGRAALTARKFDEAIVLFDKAAASPESNEQIKMIAASDKKRAESLKK